jgi:acyl carrier protein
MPNPAMERLHKVFRETFDVPGLQLSPKMTAKDVEAWDSFNHINLVIGIETEFNLSFTTLEISNLANVGELIDLMRRKGVDIQW